MGAPHEKGLMLVKIEALREFMTTILSDLQTLEHEIQNSGPQDNGKSEETAS